MAQYGHSKQNLVSFPFILGIFCFVVRCVEEKGVGL